MFSKLENKQLWDYTPFTIQQRGNQKMWRW